ncbi:MAG: hypothetical protein Q7S11_01260 [bacterium]|nr:hypothetical protein [bacterium]
MFTTFVKRLTPLQWVTWISIFMATLATAYSFYYGYTISYGDAESHLNIAKRVIESLTPGFAQLGGIWLPLPHILLIPFVYFDVLWRTGLAGAIISGIAFVISAIYIYKLAFLLTKHSGASFVASLVFIINPNVLYLQSTPMTELTLIVFFVLSSYYFISFLLDDSNLLMLILAAFFGFCASLSRYDGWGLVLMEAGILVLHYLPYKIRVDWSNVSRKIQNVFIPSTDRTFGERWGLLEGRLIMFATMAFFGIALWILWGFLILGDPLYFTHSEFSANSQQLSWFARGELPAYKHLDVAFLYYFVTSVESSGFVLSLAAMIGMILFFLSKRTQYRSYIFLILMVPFIFNILTLYLGQSVIFIPGITPTTFEWTLFNVRYGVMMLPLIALFIGYLFYRAKFAMRVMIIGIIALQSALFYIGFTPVLSLDDSVSGLSSAIAKMPDAQQWLEDNYDHGKLLTDDFARTISIIRTPVHMKDVIYIGNKPYWEESLIEPEKYARWIVMQQNDTLWKNIYEDRQTNARLFKYFNKVYTSEDILIFRRIDN